MDKRKEAVLAETGKFLIDIAKLVFGGVILAGIMRFEEIDPWVLFGLGGLAMIILLLTGIAFLAYPKDKEE